jgi:hypothetical protein
MLRAVLETARWTTAKIAAIRDLLDKTAETIRREAPKIYSRELAELLFTQPYCRIGNVVEIGIAQRQSASVYLRKLVEIGLLEERTMGREKVFINPAFVRLLTTGSAIYRDAHRLFSYSRGQGSDDKADLTTKRKECSFDIDSTPTVFCSMAFPDYDGNGMFKSLGNVMVNPHVGLLFIAMHDKPKRLRVNGIARISESDPLLGETVGAQLIVRVEAKAIFPNCPRYIPNMKMTGPSIYAPQPKCEPLEPAWKSFDSFKDYVHPRQPTFKG